MTRSRSPRAAVPLGSSELQELALRYVGKYATSRAKLIHYLARKVRERGWVEALAPDYEGIAERFAELGYVDDAAFALSKSRALSNRGYGRRRVDEKLRAAGIDEESGAAARDHADAEAVESALRFARRRKFGPFAAADSEPKQREKALAAMLRAGHPHRLAREIVYMLPGTDADIEQFRERMTLS